MLVKHSPEEGRRKKELHSEIVSSLQHVDACLARMDSSNEGRRKVIVIEVHSIKVEQISHTNIQLFRNRLNSWRVDNSKNSCFKKNKQNKFIYGLKTQDKVYRALEIPQSSFINFISVSKNSKTPWRNQQKVSCNWNTATFHSIALRVRKNFWNLHPLDTVE